MEDVTGITDTSPTSFLPCEIWSHIFAFLPLADRKGVRLTCRSCVEHIAEVMLRPSYSLLNLELQGLPVRMLPANVWKASGTRIRELEFHMCQWDDETISNIILHCENLTSLVITEDEYADDDVKLRRIRIAYSPRLLKGIFEKGIRRPKLHTLFIYIKYGEHESVLRKVFLLYPCMKHLTFKLICDRSNFLVPSAMRLGLNPDTQLESLTPVILTRKGKMGTLVDQTEQGLMRLKYFETSWLVNNSASQSVENDIFNFFGSQRNLEVIKLTTRIASVDSTKLFYPILESCPKLQEFYLVTATCMNLKPPEVPRFIASIFKLKCLELCFELDDSEEVPSFSDLLPNTVQLNLTYLDWDYLRAYPDFWDAFLQRCSTLKHLRLAECCDTTLQIIFQHLPELQTLVVDDTMHCTNFGFFGLTEDGNEDGYSIKRLQHLKHLELHWSSIDLTERTAIELQLPRLEFLNLYALWFNQLSEEALNRLASHLPKLRVLAVDPHLEKNYIIKEIIPLCRHLNNLHHLIFPWYFALFGDILKENVESIFSTCPSLRYISDRVRHAFMRDPFTGKILFEGCQKSFKHVFRYPYWRSEVRLLSLEFAGASKP